MKQFKMYAGSRRYSNVVECPYCGFTARPLCSNDGVTWKYVCNRCKSIFTV